MRVQDGHKWSNALNKQDDWFHTNGGCNQQRRCRRQPCKAWMVGLRLTMTVRAMRVQLYN
jgi:hypothetical protein